MLRRDAVNASPLQYAKRHASERGVMLYADKRYFYVETDGVLHTVTTYNDKADDWEPIRGDEA